jgi:hypothetical protein
MIALGERSDVRHNALGKIGARHLRVCKLIYRKPK